MSCCAVGCHNSFKKKLQGISFHYFPKNEDLKRVWVNAVMRANWWPSPRSYLCTDHFEERYVVRHRTKILLKDNAVPTFFELKPRAKRKPRTSKSRVKTFDEKLHKKKLEELEEQNKPPKSPDELVWKEAVIKLPKLDLAFAAPPGEAREGGGDVFVGSEYLMKYYELKEGCGVPTKFKKHYPVQPYDPPAGEHGYSLPPTDNMVRLRLQKYQESNEKVQKKLHNVCRQLARTKKSLEAYRKKEAESLKKANQKKEEVAKAAAPKNLLEEILALVNSNEKKIKKMRKRPQAYSDSIKEFVQTLYKKSPEAYHYVRFAFENALPQRSTLIKWNKLSKANMVEVENAENVQRNE